MQLTVPTPIAHSWVFDDNHAPPVYRRPVVGSELLTDRASSFGDGLSEVCMGANFTSVYSMAEVQKKVRRALAKLRFFCPIIAATVEGPDDAPYSRHWVYAPMKNGADCEAWLDAVLAVEDRGASLDTHGFVDRITRSRLPVDSQGRRSVFQCYLLSDDTGAHGLYFHGSHSILDGWPTFYALALMFEWMVEDTLDAPLGLEFGTEHKYLPPDTVSVSGGPRGAWATSGVELFAEAAQHRAKTTPILVLLPPSRTVCTDGPRVQLEHVFPPAEADKIVAVSKRHGLSPTQLLEAAHCLALAASNPELSAFPEVDFSAETTIASLEKEFVGVDKKTHFVSAFSIMPVRVPMRPILDVASTREQLLLAAQALKAAYARYQANPCLAHLLVAQFAMPMPDMSAQAEGGQSVPPINPTMLTNLGRVDARLPSTYLDLKTGKRALHVHDMCFGHRITTSNVVLHSWTFDDGLHVQLQASDVWTSDADKAYLERFLDTMRRLVLEQLD